ncbi:hypothetical protein ABEF95_014468 [Exophiala dermatitidis]
MSMGRNLFNANPLAGSYAIDTHANTVYLLDVTAAQFAALVISAGPQATCFDNDIYDLDNNQSPNHDSKHNHHFYNVNNDNDNANANHNYHHH